MRGLILLGCVVALASATPHAQGPETTVPAARFVGTWVGTQAWAIADPPPGSRQDQPVTLVIENVDGKLRGTLTPFLGGEEGVTFVDGQIVGADLQATGAMGRGRGAGWKAPVRVAFVFRNEGLVVTGSADVKMGDVPWTKFSYKLEKKRSRY